MSPRLILPITFSLPEIIVITENISAGTESNYVGITLERGMGIFTSNPDGYSVDEARFKADNDILYLIGAESSEIAVKENTTLSISEAERFRNRLTTAVQA